ncbi:unnamed protein product, partial [Iphiclides podalirius]
MVSNLPTRALQEDPEYDPFCDPAAPKKIKYEDILAASRRCVGCVVNTPCMKAHMSETLGIDLYFKQEFLQHTGSFKERGVCNTLLLLSDEQKKNGVITASTGNHGSALSYHATRLGIPCIVVMPLRAPLTKITKCTNFGVKPKLHGANIGESKLFAMTLGKERKMMYINGFDHPNIVEGQGTAGLEILAQVPDVDAIIIPVGGGSLITGVAVVAKHLKPNVEIYGVETDKTCSMVETFRKNERIYFPIDTTIADGLGVNKVGVNTFHTLKGIVDKLVAVKEDWVARAVMHIVEEERFVVEGAGAVGVAAVMAGLFPNLKGKKVVCILTGGNIDTNILARALERGMAAEGRLVKFKVTVSDRPGGMADLCNVMAQCGVTLRDCIPERAWVKGDVFSVEVKVIAETRGWEHTRELMESIKKNFKECVFPEMGAHAEKSTVRRGPCLAPNPEDYDELCDPDNPRQIKYEEIVSAFNQSKAFINQTPCYHSQSSKDFGINIYHKLEFVLKTGSFKERGALNALQKLPLNKKKIGVVLASLGNQAMGLCYYGRILNIPVIVVMPKGVPIIKVQMCKNYGAKVIVEGNELPDSQKYARRIAREKGLTYINGRDHPDVLTGYGGVALEILEQVPNIDAVIVPVGTGGLLAAVATVIKHAKPDCLVYGVQSEMMPTFYESLENGSAVTKPMNNSLAEGIAMPYVGANSFHIAHQLIDKMMLVAEDWIARAVLHLIEKERFVVEGAGACTMAAILSSLVPELKSKNVVCILSGGNIDAILLNRSIERGLAAEGRLVKFKVGIKAESAQMAQLLKLIADGGYNLVRQFMDRIWVEEEIHHVEVKIVCETRDLQHALQLKKMIEGAYPTTAFFETKPLNDKHICPCYIRKS